MTDQETLSELQYALIETVDGGATVSSGLWTVDEFIDALNSAQQWLMRELWPVVSVTTVPTVPNQPRHPLPQDWMETIRVAWQDSDGSLAPLARDSSWSFDNLDEAWSYVLASNPLSYSDSDTPMPQIQVMPASSDNGLLHIWYAALPPALSNTGVMWTLPDAMVPVAKWKALAILLAKDGRGQDLPRAQAAEQRAEEGLEMAKLMLKGWMA
jgi:hypothetical protein